MITALEIENYRGFGKRQRIDLSSVNLFYGANSAGKSTVTNALLFIHEFMVMGNESPERSLLGGRFVNFGSYRELAHKGDGTVHAASAEGITVIFWVEVAAHDPVPTV